MLAFLENYGEETLLEKSKAEYNLYMDNKHIQVYIASLGTKVMARVNDSIMT